MPDSAEPKVTVFMAVYNREAFLQESLQSVLDQTFRDFELLVVDDGSTDGSVGVVQGLSDPRIRLVRHETNQGIPKTRNRGLALARGRYLAILDSDDFAYPRRLERQVAFLDANPEIAAVGSWARRVTSDGRKASPALRPTGSREIRARIPFTTCFKNPTMMARTAAMREFGYREQFVICQDIDMWSRMSGKYALANLPEFLVRYRLGGTSHRDGDLSAAMKKQAAADQLRDLGVAFDDRDIDRHYKLRNPKNHEFDADYVEWCEEWLLRLIETNRVNRCYPEPEFSQAAAERWWRLALFCAGRTVPAAPFLRPTALRRHLQGVLGSVARMSAQRVTSEILSR